METKMVGEFRFTKVKNQYYPERTGFRPNTPMFPLKLNFLFMNGGMGDYLTWIQPILWLANEATWIEGTVVCPTYFKEILDYFLKPFTTWRYADYKDITSIPEFKDVPFRGPVELARESLNATGAHLSTCGWVYFTNKDKPAPGYEHYAQFPAKFLESLELPPEAAALNPKKYAVITTGITTNSRAVPQGGWNPIIDHIRSKGLTPVFLGKSTMETGNASNVLTGWVDGTNYAAGLDLRDKTTLLQAAAIMHKAAFVIGHDNGLLHLAGCTPDVPIIFGYNIAAPEHRRPSRPNGRVFDITLTPKELACIHCQSNTNFVIGYNFKECFYKDLACMKMLFERNGIRWLQQIDHVLALKY